MHANAHYTYVFDGNDKLFARSPSATSNRGWTASFIRVHRSHIVNIDRVVGYKRSGDSELVEMAGAHNYLVPVSRSRIGSLKSRVATLNGGRSGICAAPAASSCSAINPLASSRMRQ